MKQPYSIIKTFLGNVEYLFPSPLESLILYGDTVVEQSTDIGVKVLSADESFIFVVEVQVFVAEGFKGRKDLQMKIVYSAVVKANDKKMDKDKMAKLLGAEIPKKIFGKIRNTVKGLTSASGFPQIVLEDYDSYATLPKQLSINSSAANCETQMGYNWIIQDIKSTKEGVAFLDSLIKTFGNSCLKYEESPLYKYFFRFLNPIKYRHPQFNECNEAFWDMLFQFVLGESDYFNITKGENGLPEIEFSFNDFKNQKLSALTFKEIKELTSELATRAFTSTLILLYSQVINQEYGKTLSNNPPLEAELHTLFNYSPHKMTDDSLKLVNRICSRIKEYDEQTFYYRLLNK